MVLFEFGIIIFRGAGVKENQQPSPPAIDRTIRVGESSCAPRAVRRQPESRRPELYTMYTHKSLILKDKFREIGLSTQSKLIREPQPRAAGLQGSSSAGHRAGGSIPVRT